MDIESIRGSYALAHDDNGVPSCRRFLLLNHVVPNFADASRMYTWQIMCNKTFLGRATASLLLEWSPMPVHSRPGLAQAFQKNSNHPIPRLS